MKSKAFRRFRMVCAWALFSILLGNGALGVSARQAGQKPAPIPLELGKPVERELKGGESHEYRLDLKKGRFIHLKCKQDGINTGIQVFNSSHVEIINENILSGKYETEEIFLIADKDEAFQVIISSPDPEHDIGRYEAWIETSREATPQDEKRFTSLLQYKKGQALCLAQTKESLAEAVKLLGESLSTWRELKDDYREGFTLVETGLAHDWLSDSEKALDYYNQALVAFQRNGNKHGEAHIFNNLAILYDAMGFPQKGLEYSKQSLTLSQLVKNRKEAANSFDISAGITLALGLTYEAIDLHFKALAIQREIGDQEGEATTTHNIAAAYLECGELGKSVEYYRKAIPIWRAIQYTRGEAASFSNLGKTYMAFGELQKATNAFFESLKLSRVVGNQFIEAHALNNIGSIYNTLGEPRIALEYHENALAIARRINNPTLEGVIHKKIGDILYSRDDQAKALEYFNKALAIGKQIENRANEMEALIAFGKLYLAQNKVQKALQSYGEALKISGEIANPRAEGFILEDLGTSFQRLGDTRKANDYFVKSLDVQKTVGDKLAQAQIHHQIAKLKRTTGEIDLARENIEKAVAIVETVRSQVVNQESRTSFFAKISDYYDTYIDILMDSYKRSPSPEKLAQAFQANEQSRARSLLELLIESRADIRQGVDEALLEHEKDLQQRITAKADILVRFKSTKGRETQAEAMEKEISTLTTEFEQVRADIRQKSPRHAALTQPQPMSLDEVRKLLDSDTVLLEYALGDEGGYLWAVTKDDATVSQLPKEKIIDAAARKCHGLLSDAALVGTPGHAAACLKATAELSRLVLGPVADKLDKKRIVVVADGALQYIPFGALPLPRRVENEKNEKQGSTSTQNSKLKTPNPPSPLLIERCEVVNLPSATALAVQRREFSDRKPAEKLVAVVADPVFSAKDPRITLAKSVEKPAGTLAAQRETPTGNQPNPDDPGTEVNLRDIDLRMAKLRQSAEETAVSEKGDEPRIPRLRFAKREAENILSLVPSDKVKKAVDFDANKSVVAGSNLEQYQVVHFATHGFLNAEHPELSGLVLSLVDENGVQRDGFLRTMDVFNLNLSAETVVLSACRTGLGKEVKGEGLMGLSRGFLHAGAKRLVVSLWSVDDQATTELMKRFYQKMLAEKQRPAAALRAAQLELMGEKQWKSPFFWAPFVVQGEWN